MRNHHKQESSTRYAPNEETRWKCEVNELLHRHRKRILNLTQLHINSLNGFRTLFSFILRAGNLYNESMYILPFTYTYTLYTLVIITLKSLSLAMAENEDFSLLFFLLFYTYNECKCILMYIKQWEESSLSPLTPPPSPKPIRQK